MVRVDCRAKTLRRKGEWCQPLLGPSGIDAGKPQTNGETDNESLGQRPTQKRAVVVPHFEVNDRHRYRVISGGESSFSH